VPGLVIAPFRPDDPAAGEQPPLYAADDTVEHLDTTLFRIHFTRDGEHAVPARDADSDGTPDFVRDVAREYDAVHAFYRDELGFLDPLSDAWMPDDDGGDGRFDVYLLDFGTSADGAFRAQGCMPDKPFRCSGYMLHENDFDGRNYPSLEIATRILASHEYFHAIQAAYHVGASSVLGEGTAVWASETYDRSLDDFEGFVGAYLERPDRSLTTEPTGPVDPYSYASALFFQFLSARYEPALIRELWQALLETEADKPSWTEALDGVLTRTPAYSSSLAEAFADFTQWNLYTGSRADAKLGYADAAMYPLVAETALDLPHTDDSVRVFPLSARFYSARAGAAGPITLAAVQTETPLDGLRLILAIETRGKIHTLETASVAESDSIALDVGTGDTIHAVLLNTLLRGESLRPGVCLGSEDQVGACRRELLGEAAADGGMSQTPSDAAIARDAGEEQDEGESSVDTRDSGCAATGASTGAANGLWAALGLTLLLTWLAPRRRRE
jgi:hypothetical protein